ncbi:hypothetical protein [Aurantibacillus circumpalustris]|uniref:hypothetical protein n=1 Tax=Aurantibacillus circumpalustris TaxID=3036359 RepID=UPI00295BEBCF|nr:hypothetical protein [Aurantibacillus circumpalustris]
MKRFLLYSFIVLSCALKAQDKVYLMDGECKIVKVLEISADQITVVPISESGAPFINSNETIPTKDVVLIEYKNGTIEVYNTPKNTLTRNAIGTTRKNDQKDQQLFAFNFVSMNTLALCNADLSFFFERLVQSKKIGYGLMGAYNFNNHATIANLFIGILHNAKKSYDFGAFFNFYPGHFKRKTTFCMGALIKYTSFSFSSVKEETSGTSTIVKYTPSTGSQLAFIFNIGTHTNFKNNFFFKTIAGIGGYPLFGEYKKQVNYLVNKDADPNTKPINYSFFPKIYLGINLGLSF